jgi:type IV pilus assembly protein PilA
MYSLKKQNGFTLLEVLLVVGIIAILAGIVIVAINPAKQLANTRNAQRHADINTILNAAYQYAIDNNGTIPSTITTSSTEVCKSGIAFTTCSSSSLIYLGMLTDNEEYIVSIPIDPSSTSTNGAGYAILKTANGRITVSASLAEQGESISVTR